MSDRQNAEGSLPPTVITPTVGRVVWFHPAPGGDGGLNNYSRQPMAAQVCYVLGDRMVNLSVTDHAGQVVPRTSVTLRQDGDPVPTGSYCEWMPYQLGQAKKAAP